MVLFRQRISLFSTNGGKAGGLGLEGLPTETLTTRHSSPQTLLSRSHDSHSRLLLSMVLAALAVRLIVVAFVYQGFLEPERDHWAFGSEAGKVARSIVLGHGFGNPYYGGDTGPTAEIGPVLPYILAGIFALFGIYTKTAAVAMLGLNSLFSALTCIPIFYLAKESFGLREARWAVWTWVFFPYAIYFSADSMWDHALIALLLNCILWAALCLQDSTRIWAWAGFGLLSGFSALTNPVALSVVPFLGGWACYRLRKQGRIWLAPAVVACIFLCAPLVPWLVRNHRVFQRPVFLRDSFPLAFSSGNVGDAHHWWNASVDPTGNAAEMAQFRRVGELAYMAEKRAQGLDFLVNHPGIFVWRSVRRFIYLWTGYWSFNKDYLQEEVFDPENIPFCTATTGIALIGLRRMLQRDAQKTMPYAIMLVVFPLVYYITVPAMAYRQPLDPVLVVLASHGVVSSLRSCRLAN